ncbi:MAG TPA: hypothetical protein VGR77_11465 [Candidatus Dormibacteraeota bacterium]|nr:hypothetical protein [Candidatus Dormibacteraeota bacterium]
MNEILGFQVEPDARARMWLASHRADRRLVVAYEETRCCGGGRICDVRIRDERRAERWSLARIGSVDGRDLLLDTRIAGRLPRRLPLTVRGLGPLQHLSLDLAGEEWASLLFD